MIKDSKIQKNKIKNEMKWSNVTLKYHVSDIEIF